MKFDYFTIDTHSTENIYFYLYQIKLIFYFDFRSQYFFKYKPIFCNKVNFNQRFIFQPRQSFHYLFL